VAKILVIKYLDTDFLSGCNLEIEYVVVRSVRECLVPIFLGDQFNHQKLMEY